MKSSRKEFGETGWDQTIEDFISQTTDFDFIV